MKCLRKYKIELIVWDEMIVSLGVLKMAILIDKRIQKYVEGFLYGENDEIINIHLKDIDETFWFDSELAAQEFLNKQAIERVGDPELRKDSFCYKDQEGEIHRYLITVNKKGQIVSYLEEVMDEEEVEFWEE
jgi:hypothetical protein